MDVVRDMDWNYFQAAPRAQQVPSLNGDEWLLMEGMHPELYRIQAQLPNAIAHIEVNHDNIQFSAPKLDTVSIDAEEMRCSLVWRSNAVLESDEMLRNIIMYAGARDAAQSDDHWNTVLSVARGSEPSSGCLLYTSPSPRDATLSRMPSSA